MRKLIIGTALLAVIVLVACEEATAPAPSIMRRVEVHRGVVVDRTTEVRRTPGRPDRHPRHDADLHRGSLGVDLRPAVGNDRVGHSRAATKCSTTPKSCSNLPQALAAWCSTRSRMPPR